MKSVISLVIALYLSVQLYAQDPITAKAQLQNAIIYTNGVELSHTAKTFIPAGSHEIIIDNVANKINDNTIQVGANANITIMSVVFSKDYLLDKTKHPNYIKIEDSIKSVRKKIQLLNDEKATEEDLLKLMEKNHSVSGTDAGLKVDELTKLADYQKRKLTEIRKNIFKLNEKVAVQNKLINKLQQQLNEMGGNPNQTGGQIKVQLMAKNSTNTEFKIKYISPNASWTPFYDLRSKSVGSPLEIVYKANVTQYTGIDWKAIPLTLSTGAPLQSNNAPELNTWFLRYGMNKQAAQKPLAQDKGTYYRSTEQINATETSSTQNALKIKGLASSIDNNEPLIIVDGNIYTGKLSEISSNDIASLDVIKDEAATSMYGSRGANGVINITTKSSSLAQYTNMKEQQLNAVFNVSIPYDIASNAKPHSVTLQEFKHPVNYIYYTVPKIDVAVYLVAELSDYGKLNLLPGEANIVFEDMYVGKTFISPSIVNDTLQLSMGKDKRIVTERKTVIEKTSAKFIGNNQKHTYTYDITIKNSKQESITILVKDQYPIATDNTIEVELIESANAQINKETGELSWKLTVAPNASETKRISYSVKFPKGKIIGNMP